MVNLLFSHVQTHIHAQAYLLYARLLRCPMTAIYIFSHRKTMDKHTRTNTPQYLVTQFLVHRLVGTFSTHSYHTSLCLFAVAESRRVCVWCTDHNSEARLDHSVAGSLIIPAALCCQWTLSKVRRGREGQLEEEEVMKGMMERERECVLRMDGGFRMNGGGKEAIVLSAYLFIPHS